MSSRISKSHKVQFLLAAQRAGFIVLHNSVGVFSLSATFEAQVRRKTIRFLVYGEQHEIRRQIKRALRQFDALNDEEFRRDFEVPCWFLFGDFPEVLFGPRDIAGYIRLLLNVRKILHY